MFAERVEVLRFMASNDGHATCRELGRECGLSAASCYKALHTLKGNGTVRRLHGIGPWARWALTAPLEPFGKSTPGPLQL